MFKILLFFLYFDQINAVLLSIQDFQKHKNIIIIYVLYI